MTKIIGELTLIHDSGIFVLDKNKDKPFALTRERITRHKHDIGLPYEPLEFLNSLNSMKDEKVVIAHGGRYVPFPLYWYFTDRNKHSKELRENGSIRNKIDNSMLRHAFNFAETSTLNVKPVEWFNNFLSKQYLRYKTPVFKNAKWEMYDHHTCHAASAYYFSNFDKSCVVTMDAAGDRYCSKVFIGKGDDLEYINGTSAMESLGYVYSFFTEALGFIMNSDEGKVEALAAYGNPNNKLYKKMKDKIYIDGLKLRVKKPFNDQTANVMDKLYYPLVKQYKKEDCAAAVQRILEEVGIDLVRNCIDEFGIKKFSFAGGNFANVIMNMRIFEESGLKQMYVFPAMGDDGTAAGAALLSALDKGWNIKRYTEDEMPYYGPSYNQRDIKNALKQFNEVTYEYIGDGWPEMTAEMVSKGHIMSIYHGNMEFGPRALGNRSVLADPRNLKTKDKINNTIKRRHWFQPFCPSILESERRRLFEKSYKNKHMTCAFKVKEEYRREIPAVMHIDGTARPQFVEKNDNVNYYRFLRELKKLTGYGVVLNTSFNLHGRTIVMTPEHALRDFIDCGLDAMMLEGWLVKRK